MTILRFATLAVPVFLFGCGDSSEPISPAASYADLSSRPPESVDEWRQHRSEFDATTWNDEATARHHEQVLVALWDRLLAASGDPDATLQALSGVEFETLAVGAPRLAETLDHGIERLELVEVLTRCDYFRAAQVRT